MKLVGFHGISIDFHHFPRKKRSPVDLGDLPAAQRPSAVQGVLARREEASAREAREARHEAARAQVEAQEEVPRREMRCWPWEVHLLNIWWYYMVWYIYIYI